MTEKREVRITPHMRIAYPMFEDESASDHVLEMNAFYTVLTDALAVYAEEIAEDRAGGIRILTADYKTRAENNRIAVEYRLAVRRRGKTEAAKTLLHIWENGVLVPPQKRRSHCSKLRRMIRQLLTGRRR